MQLEERERLRLHALLNGSDKAVRQIEAAITHYAEMLPMARAAKQLPSEVKKDADDLHKALQTIVRIIADGGDAWEFFKSNAADEGLVKPLHQLTEALGPGAGEPGDALVLIAEQNAADLKPKKSRPRSPDKVSRFSLMFHVANAARDAGVLISRNSTAFQEITAAVFLAANIHADPDHDIREFLKTFTE
ncbi:hypothetical protein [Limnohabitans curvus]|uniref:hypothetical protein n=1 Tax=Limnohabitans curvus TaxID=323423 RepID=UPI0011B2367F|nr:hypothetical protein [Limnohabitans curvus]